MHTITRNASNNKKGVHLVEFFDGQPLVTVKNAKALCGYSETSGNDVILDKVSSHNRVSKVGISKKGIINEKFYITLNGFYELSSKLKQKDKIQNVKLAIELIEEAINTVAAYYLSDNDIEVPKIEEKSIDEDKIVEQIKTIVGEYNSNKQKWVKLYDELDKVLDESIRKSHQKYKDKHNSKISLINFIKKETKLLPLLYDIAVGMYK